MLYNRFFFPVLLLALAVLFSCKHKTNKNTNEVGGTHNAELTDAPFVPASGSWDKPQKVVVHLEILEVEKEIMDGTTYTFWTFGGKVPGKFIRIKKGDEVEFHLSNHPSNKLPHNIDLHAVNGPGGGAEASLTAPGHTSVFSFKALNPGLYVYHCATAPVGMHIGNGMYGLIFVEDPGKMLPKVDHEFYIMQGEFYTKEKFGEQGHTTFSMENAIDENPTYVLFNGAVGSTLGDKSLKVKSGETVRLYVGNAGPNLVSSFHVIGEIFDKVYVEGSTSHVNENVQTTIIPAGGAAIVEFKVNAPGTYHMVDHSIFRAFNKGALADITASGEHDSVVYSGKQRDEVYLLEGTNIRTSEKAVTPEFKERSVAERVTLGKAIYIQNCSACHQTNGQGIKGVFPPLAGSDYLQKRADKGVNIVLHGLQDTISVNGVIYRAQMPILGLNDDEVANVLTYIRSSWGNNYGEVTLSDVRKFKK